MTELKTLKDIDWVKINRIDLNAEYEEDEYSSMAWGSPEDIQYLVECLYLFKDEQKKNIILFPERIFDISINRIKELIDLFKQKDFDINKDWKEIKRHFFNLTEEDLK